MWTVASEELESGRGVALRLFARDQPLRWGEVLELWQTSLAFRGRFIDWLAELPYEAFRWETPALSKASLAQAFECVVVDSPGLASVPDEAAFAEQFERGIDGIATFTNLGGDATLIVPCPLVDADAYNHLARFLRTAPTMQKHALWQRVGQSVERLVSDTPLWLSTAGAGVSWLHVRIDQRPKYYVHLPYTRLIAYSQG